MQAVELVFTPEAYEKISRIEGVLEEISITIRESIVYSLSVHRKTFREVDFQVLVFITVFSINAPDLGVRVMIATSNEYDPPGYVFRDLAKLLKDYLQGSLASLEIDTEVWVIPIWGALRE